MKTTKLAARCSALAAAAALSLAPTAARAETYSGDGWLQLRSSKSESASKEIAGKDFGVGYQAYFALDGYNWDVASDTITTTCSTYTVYSSPASMVVEGNCGSLPGKAISDSLSVAMVTYNGYLAQKMTITRVWDVQDSGAMAQADGYFKVPVTLFGDDVDLFKLTGTATGKSYDSDTIGSDLYVAGAKIYSVSTSLPAYKQLAKQCVTLFEAEASYSLLGIPITVSASSDGCIYVDVSASWSNNTLSGSLTPGASVDATISAGVGGDAGFASVEAGVYGNITVVDASLPLTISAAVGTSSLKVTESAKLTMTGLDGEVGLYAEGCLLGICEDASKTLFDWTGMTYASTTIYSASQTLSY